LSAAFLFPLIPHSFPLAKQWKLRIKDEFSQVEANLDNIDSISKKELNMS
jgi:hypothetical protein